MNSNGFKNRISVNEEDGSSNGLLKVKNYGWDSASESLYARFTEFLSQFEPNTIEAIA